MQTRRSFRAQKRGDLVVEEIKRWIGEGWLIPGDKLAERNSVAGAVRRHQGNKVRRVFRTVVSAN